MQKQIDNILQKRMDRKDFLKHVVLGLAVVTGTAGVLKSLAPRMNADKQGQNGLDYGMSSYGGVSTNPKKA